MQISETDLDRDYAIFTEDDLLRLGVTRRTFYVDTQAPADELARRLAEFKAALGAS